MSTVFLGHTGQRLAFDPSAVSTLEALRAFVAEHGISLRNQILLTAHGKQVRTQTMLTEHELFVFDSSLLNTKSNSAPALPPGLTASSSGDDGGNDHDPGVPPDTISNQNDLQAWQELFHVRHTWASNLLTSCEARARLAEQYIDEQAVIERSLGVAVTSLQQHIKSAEQKFTTAESWAGEALRALEQRIANWQANLESLRDIPARADFSRFIQSPGSTGQRLSQHGNLSTLQGFVDVSSVAKAADRVKTMAASFSDQLSSMRDNLASAKVKADELVNAVDRINSESTTNRLAEPGQLLEEIDLVVAKMGSDLEHVQSLPQSLQSVSQASKRALLHTRNYLPNISDFCTEMNALVRQMRQERDSTAQSALEHMRTLSGVESVLAELYQMMKTLDLPRDETNSIDLLNFVARLPSVYGALIVEAVRRQEWVIKMKRDSETLQEEFANYQHEETKRRSKWMQAIQDVCKPDSLSSSVLGIELSLENEGGSWPITTRNELQDYAKALDEAYGDCSVTQEMDQAIKELDKPTRRQIRHARAFKNGSVHEAFGETSLLLRGDEQTKTLRESNGRLEDELKAQKSRVRKLEDLLHRQVHISRVNTNDIFPPSAGSEGSFGARRLSSTAKEGEEKRLARRIVDLEAEVRTAREAASTRKPSDVEVQKQFEEAVSTKNDLMENMEAQQREFATERRGLEKELIEAKERVEELENEMERIVGSRDDERTGADARVLALEKEIATLKDEAIGHAARAATAADARSNLERQLELTESARAAVELELRQIQSEQEQERETQAEQLQVLATAHAHLAPEVEPPTSTAGLVSALEELARKSMAHVKDLAEAVAFAKSENESLWASNERQKTELAATIERKSTAEEQYREAQEALASEEAKAGSLEQQLQDEQAQLRILRSKFADGETGSEVLRQRVAEEETKVGKLSSQLAEAKSHINSLDVELMRLKKVHTSMQSNAEENTNRLEKRAEHAKDISQRLLLQISRLNRLLERLGLAVSYHNGEMVIERASKLGASTAGMPESRAALDRTVSLASPAPTRKPSYVDELVDPSILRWPEALDTQNEINQFEAFVQQISRFNIDTFSDAVVKRLRDFEYTAKKYNKEAKESGKRAEAYKERSVKLRTESHSKIAVRDFKEGDLALFLPTRGQAKGAWAAFNINCPHYFLAEKEGMRLATRDFIVARIGKIEQKLVDLSKTGPTSKRRSTDMAVDPALAGDANDNPFDLSDGLTWWLVHAAEERGSGGAPSTPGLGKSTVVVANVDAKGSIRIKRSNKSDDASKHLNKSLESRRSSSASKKGVAGAFIPTIASNNASPTAAVFADASSSAAASLHSRNRSESIAEGKTAAEPPSSSSRVANMSGFGITQDTSPTPDDWPGSLHDPQINLVLSNDRFPSREAAASSHLRPVSPAVSATRHESEAGSLSNSPSKSIRSLQKHLEPKSRQASPAKSVVSAKKQAFQQQQKQQQQQQQQGWEPLWQTQFSLESPVKKGASSS